MVSGCHFYWIQSMKWKSKRTDRNEFVFIALKLEQDLRIFDRNDSFHIWFIYSFVIIKLQIDCITKHQILCIILLIPISIDCHYIPFTIRSKGVYNGHHKNYSQKHTLKRTSMGVETTEKPGRFGKNSKYEQIEIHLKKPESNQCFPLNFNNSWATKYNSHFFHFVFI